MKKILLLLFIFLLFGGTAGVSFGGEKVVGSLETISETEKGTPPVNFSRNPIEKWARSAANPNLVYLLLVFGLYALAYELSAPGIGLGAVVGTLCLVSAVVLLHVLPLNLTGLGLLVGGIALMGLDVFIGSHGVLIFTGLGTFALGSFFLFDAREPAVRVSRELITAVAATSAGFFGIVVRKIWTARRKKPVTGAEGLVGQTGEVRGEGMVFVEGALWTVEGKMPGCVPGDRVRVVSLSGNRLVVQKED